MIHILAYESVVGTPAPEQSIRASRYPKPYNYFFGSVSRRTNSKLFLLRRTFAVDSVKMVARTWSPPVAAAGSLTRGYLLDGVKDGKVARAPNFTNSPAL